jgi:hypothetical protein
MSKIYVILVEYCMKLTLLYASKGSNYYKHVGKKRIILESSRKLANRLFYCENTIRPKKDTKLCIRVEKWSRSV